MKGHISGEDAFAALTMVETQESEQEGMGLLYKKFTPVMTLIPSHRQSPHDLLPSSTLPQP